VDFKAIINYTLQSSHMEIQFGLRKKKLIKFKQRKCLVFGCAVNPNNFYFLILLFTSPHVSASIGLP
jgi:hypothetical protein